MNHEAHTFLSALFSQCSSGFITLTAIQPDKPTPSCHLPIGQPLDLMLDKLLTANQKGWNAFFGVALRQAALGRWRRGGNADLLALPAFFADLDCSPAESLQYLRACPLAPSALVASGRGVHGYWFLDPPVTDWPYAAAMLRQLAQQLHGDRTAVAESLRLPGTLNHKYPGQVCCHLLELHPAQRYHPRDFECYYRPAPVQTVPRFNFTATQLNPRVLEAVVHTLYREYEGYLGRDGWLRARCPLKHQRDQPGQHFGFHMAKGVGHCFGKHGRLLLHELCSILQIRPTDYGGLYAQKS